MCFFFLIGETFFFWQQYTIINLGSIQDYFNCLKGLDYMCAVRRQYISFQLLYISAKTTSSEAMTPKMELTLTLYSSLGREMVTEISARSHST